MSMSILSRQLILDEAQQAYYSGKGVEACRYPEGSEAQLAWLSDFLWTAKVARGDSHRSHVRPAEAIAS